VPRTMNILVPLSTTLIFILSLAPTMAWADEDKPQSSLEELPAEMFLREVRQPLRQHAWAEVEGRLIHLAHGKKRKGTLRIRITFSPQSLHAQIALNKRNVYGFEQIHDAPQGEKMKLDLPDDEVDPGLFDFGIQPEDLTFAFIYWDLLEELPGTSFHRRKCRVFKLAHPNPEKGTVNVSFSASHGFPLKAEWFRRDEKTFWRELELKGAKKHGKGLWFVKEAKIQGDGWKTQVRFEHVELNPQAEKAAPK